MVRARKTRVAKAQLESVVRHPTRQALKELTNTNTPRKLHSEDQAKLVKKPVRVLRSQPSALRTSADGQENRQIRTENLSSIDHGTGTDVATIAVSTPVRNTSAKQGLARMQRETGDQLTSIVGSSAIPSIAVDASQHDSLQSTDLSLSLSSSPSEADVSRRHSVVDLRASIQRLQATPGAESSTAALRNFKRRPRQGSILGIVQQKIASVLSTPGHLPLNSTSEDPIAKLQDDNLQFEPGPDLDLSSSVLSSDDDFAPDASGTPVQNAQYSPDGFPVVVDSVESTLVGPDTTALARSLRSKRSLDDIEDSSQEKHLRSHSGKKTRLSAPRSRLAADNSPLVQKRRQGNRVKPAPLVVQVSNSASPPVASPEPSLPDLYSASVTPDIAIPSTQTKSGRSSHANPKLDKSDDAPTSTMADPQSSSPARDDSATSRTQRTQLMPLTQAPLEKHTRHTSRKPGPKVTTATLQSLLPKRRVPPKHTKRKGPARTAHTNPDSLLDGRETSRKSLFGNVMDQSSEDEHVASRPLRTSARNKPQPKRVREKMRPAVVSGRVTKKTSQSLGRQLRTYTRHSNSNQENEAETASTDMSDDDAPETSMYEAVKSKELEDARRRFADIDGWTMEYESVTVEEDRSSSQAWR